jgi:hypothetical protein
MRKLELEDVEFSIMKFEGNRQSSMFSLWVKGTYRGVLTAHKFFDGCYFEGEVNEQSPFIQEYMFTPMKYDVLKLLQNKLDIILAD